MVRRTHSHLCALVDTSGWRCTVLFRKTVFCVMPYWSCRHIWQVHDNRWTKHTTYVLYNSRLSFRLKLEELLSLALCEHVKNIVYAIYPFLTYLLIYLSDLFSSILTQWLTHSGRVAYQGSTTIHHKEVAELTANNISGGTKQKKCITKAVKARWFYKIIVR